MKEQFQVIRMIGAIFYNLALFDSYEEAIEFIKNSSEGKYKIDKYYIKEKENE